MAVLSLMHEIGLALVLLTRAGDAHAGFAAQILWCWCKLLCFGILSADACALLQACHHRAALGDTVRQQHQNSMCTHAPCLCDLN
jgi:hypothetical protein